MSIDCYHPMLNRYLEFCLVCVEEHSTELTEIEIEKIKNVADKISARCENILKRRS